VERALEAPGMVSPARLEPGTLIRIAAVVAGTAAVGAGKLLVALRLRRAPEGWRRTVGVLLRNESTRFVLSAFGLRVPDVAGTSGPAHSLEEKSARALLGFLAGEADAHYSLDWRRFVTRRRRTAFVDLVVLAFSDEGRLTRLTPYLASGSQAAPSPDLTERVHNAIVQAYNGTSRLPEADRPRALRQGVGRALASAAAGRGTEAGRYADRLLSACCLSFETRDLSSQAERFAPPPFARRRPLGFGYLSCVARPDERRSSIDLWVSAQHVGLDGVPLQDMLDRLERAWGMVEPVTFPAATPGRAFVPPHACHAPGERAVEQSITFVDFAPLVVLRRELSARYVAEIGGEVTLGTVIAWLLAQEPEFAGVRIASTVDVAASGGYERDVDVVSLRPADYATGEGPWGGFGPFAREFNRRIAAARSRTSPVRVQMQTAGLLPAWAHATLVHADPASLDDTFGTLCVTIIRNGRVFLAPMTDLGLGLGFFAIGSVALPSADGRRVTAVSVKGDTGRIGGYPAILQRVLDKAANLREPAPSVLESKGLD
jgi:hypothetical protein